MSTLLVTGATGFIGTHLVERLRTEPGCSIRILARDKTRWDGAPGMDVVCGDILDRAAVDRAVQGVSGIFHLAGFVTRDPAQYGKLFDIHVRGTQNVCEAAVAQGKPRLVLFSSSGTIAVSRSPEMHTEDSSYANAVVGRWPYYLSKIFQEKLALNYSASQGLPVIVLNPSLVLGPGDERLSSTSDVKMFIERKITIRPAGGLNFVDVRDLADVAVRAMKDGVLGRRYLIGGHNMTVPEFFSLLERVSGVRGPSMQMPESWSRFGATVLRTGGNWIGRPFPLDDISIEMSYRYWYLDNRRAKSELGLNPRAAQETLRDTVAFLRHS